MTICMGNCCSPGCRLMSMIVSFFVLSFFPRGVLDEILNLIESVSEVFSSYSCHKNVKVNPRPSLKHSWATVFKTVHEFIRISLFPCWTLPYKRSRSTQDHYLNTILVLLHTSYRCHRLINSGEDFENILTIFGHECRACHVISTV